MNPIQILKSRLSKIKINETLPSKKDLKTNLDKEQFMKDAKEVRDTFRDEDLQPRLSTI